VRTFTTWRSGVGVLEKRSPFNGGIAENMLSRVCKGVARAWPRRKKLKPEGPWTMFGSIPNHRDSRVESIYALC